MTAAAALVVASCDFCMSRHAATLDNTFGEQTNVYRVGDKIFAMVQVDGDAFVTIKNLPGDGEALRAAVAWARPGYQASGDCSDPGRIVAE